MSYKVKQEDLIGDIAGFPIEVVQAMVDEQVRQGNKADVTVFQQNSYRDKKHNGFDWDETWQKIIHGKKFHLLKKQELVPEVEGVMMEVSNNGVNWYEKLVLCKYKGLYFTWVYNWKHARPIQEKKPHTFDLTDEQATKIKSMMERGEI